MATVFAQVPEDALRYSWYPQNGSARALAIGGAMGSLGGEITSTFVNPAGIGFYKTREVVLSPGLAFNKLKADYRQNSSSDKKNSFGLGPTGFVFGSPNRYNPGSSMAFSIAVMQTANFNRSVRYNGLNNFSSFSEQFAEEFAKSNYSIDDVLTTMSPLPYSSALGLQTYLIDTVRVGGVLQVRGAPEGILDAGQALQQDMLHTSTGGIYELALAGAFNSNDKWYFGGTLGVPIVNYRSNTQFTEKDTSASNMNGFTSFDYRDNFTSTGVGFNVKLGAIYKPQEFIRIGLALHSPSVYFLTDERTANLSTALESPSGVSETFSASSTTFTNSQPGEARYMQNSPWRAIISGSYVFREIEDVQKQKGFITADIEYVNHKGSRFGSDAEVPTQSEKDYYKALNEVVKDQYKGAFNFKLGGEVKFNTIMARLGAAYYGNPYKDAAFKANSVLLSGGLGYRHRGIFIDLTYVHNMTKDANFPYRLQDRANTYAVTKQTLGNVVGTIGFKF
ncbi:MAG: hypothetical protein EOO03_02745 [Chitinophagaceae bacterium]|nr:MAG: hypothetical protein EOO03_02745 [Chitinophagaceae bacterium]